MLWGKRDAHLLLSPTSFNILQASVLKDVGNCARPSTSYKRNRRVHKDLTILNNISPDCIYKNISTCKLNKQINKTVLIIEYSNKPCLFHNKPKIVFAHKMYGFPFLDKDASYGVSRRDNYVVTAKTQKDLLRLFDFLNTNLWLVLSDAARYRQDYIDKQVFSFIPNIALLEDFPDSININTICEYFKFNDMERKYINNHKMSKWLNKF